MTSSLNLHPDKTFSAVAERAKRACFCLGVSFIFLAVLCPPARAADKNDDKKEKEKKEKIATWTEVRTSHFIVDSDSGEGTSRRIADQFEQVRRVLQTSIPNAKLDTGIPIRIVAVKDPKEFAKLLPEFPVTKDRIQPAGLFVRGREKNYVALRSNASGYAPYQDVYQEYAHLILRQTFRALPPWLEEGYANVFGGMLITAKGARLDRPDPDDLSILYASPLLPLDIVFHVDKASPFYASSDKRTVYFAESRALVHYFLTSGQSLDQYVALVEGGADSLEAAKKSFGNLDKLHDQLEAYVKQRAPAPFDVAAAGGVEGATSSKTLSPAESAAMIGEFEFGRGHIDAGRGKLEEALELDANTPGVDESLGFLLLQQSEIGDAEKHFLRAIEIDPKSALAYYGEALVSLEKSGSVGIPLDAIRSLEKSVALNPNFAPAWSSLASAYSHQSETIQKAVQAAQRAVALAPGDSGYQDELADLLRTGARPQEARRTAAPPNSQTNSSQANGSVQVSVGSPAAPPPSAPVLRTGNSDTGSAPRLERKTEPGDDKPAVRTAVEEISAPAVASASRVYSMVGTIGNVACTNTPQVVMTLTAQTIVMKLHAADIARLEVKSAGAASPIKNPSCISLRGRTARVSYQLSSEKSWDGEIQSIELRDTH